MSDITKDTPLVQIEKLAPSCSCDACSHGCTMGSGVFVKGEVERLAAFLKLERAEVEERFLEKVVHFGATFFRPKLLRAGKPWGRCIFYDGSCTIHPVKPLQCKVAMGCKPYGADIQRWFMLNYLLDKDDPKALREYKAYLDSGAETVPGGTLEELVPDKELREKALSGQMRR